MVKTDFLLEEPQKVYNIKHRDFLFSKHIILFVSEIKIDKVFYSVFDQLVRSATSVGANIVEAGAGSSKKISEVLRQSIKSLPMKQSIYLVSYSIQSNKTKVSDLLKEAMNFLKSLLQ